MHAYIKNLLYSSAIEKKNILDKLVLYEHLHPVFAMHTQHEYCLRAPSFVTLESYHSAVNEYFQPLGGVCTQLKTFLPTLSHPHSEQSFSLSANALKCNKGKKIFTP